MTASLVLALITIAGLGILALILIFFGGPKKPQQVKPVSKGSLAVKEPEKEAVDKPAPDDFTSYQEPYISDTDLALPTEEKEPDPTIASLGFSALDNLLPEPKAGTAKTTKKDTTLIVPAEFNATPKKKNTSKNLLVLHVMAREGRPFAGYELLQAVNAAGLRFGKMDIFHYLDEEEPENILFSLCSAVEPGFFDIANIGALVCPGLSLFMNMAATENPKAVFNLMLETAGQLADDLAGCLCDEKRRPLTDEKLHDYLKLAAFHKVEQV